MSKVLCERMKGRKLNTAFGLFEFDQQGIAEVPDEHVNKLLALNGYKLIGGKPAAPENNGQDDDLNAQDGAEDGQVGKNPNEEENTQNDDENDAEQAEENNDDEEQSGGKPTMTVEQLNGKNVAQLKKIAKDNNIDLAGATKKDEIIPIILGAMNQ